MPLPPYIDGDADATDEDRYQTVYASVPGAVAAPTAGLHFDEALLGDLEAKGIGLARVTLHVGAGTFQPVRVKDLSRHRMRAERYVVPARARRLPWPRRGRRHHRGAHVGGRGATGVDCGERACSSHRAIAFERSTR